MNQVLAQYKFRKQNRRFQRNLIELNASNKAEIEESRRPCSMRVFMRPRHIEILKTLGVSFLAPRLESELKTQTIGRGESYFESHGYVVSLKGFWREFRVLFRELDRQGQLYNSEVYVLDESNMTWNAIWWAHLAPKPQEPSNGTDLPQDNLKAQEDAQANKVRTGSNGLLQSNASQVGCDAEVLPYPETGFEETSQDPSDI